jgi:hypothetical protein
MVRESRLQTMTRECMDCRMNMGEKCPRCGCENLQNYFTEREPQEAGKPSLVKHYVCQNAICPHYVKTGVKLDFERGDGGITTGICPECLIKRNQELRSGKSSQADAGLR